MSDEANRAADAAEQEYHNDKKASQPVASTIKMPEPRAFTKVSMGSDKATVLSAGRDSVMFYKTHAIAVWSGDIVYFPDCNLDRADMRIVNGWQPDTIHMRCQSSEFDFILGAFFTRLGMGLAKGDPR